MSARRAGRSPQDNPGPAVNNPTGNEENSMADRTDMSPTAAVEAGDGGKQYAVARLGAVEVVVCESLAEPGRVVVDVLTDIEPGAVPLAVSLNDGYLFGGPAGEAPAGAPDLTTREGRAIAALFASCTALGDKWSGGDVISLLNQWFADLGLDVERPTARRT